MQVESAYAKTVMNMLKNRDEDIEKLTKRYVSASLLNLNNILFTFIIKISEFLRL